ncbi:MAG: ABC transporter permease subunit [Acetobacteraceae bacterium]
MLVWARSGRVVAWAVLGILAIPIYALPAVIIFLASIAGQWNGVLPSHFTIEHYANALHGASGLMLRASIITGVFASAAALINGTWAALALRGTRAAPRRVLDIIFFIPSAVPSVSVGLGLLVAFSRPPLLLNGTIAIVLIAHFVLISAYTYGNVSAGLMRMAPEYEQVAESLGALPWYRLRHVTLPLVLPYLIAAFSLSFALSMGELGATIMVYPPGWVTLPVGIFGITDRGQVFDGSALTILLGVAALIVLIALSRIPVKAAQH